MARLAEYLANQARRPVVDSTGLKGSYDFRLDWATDETGSPSIFAALQERIGLKLTSTKAPVEIIVIDNAQKPSPH